MRECAELLGGTLEAGPEGERFAERDGSDRGESGRDTAAGPLPDGLTTREAEVLALVAEGLSNPEIARRLMIAPATVKTHINNLFAKTAVRDRAQAVRYAYRYGIAAPRDDDSGSFIT